MKYFLNLSLIFFVIVNAYAGGKTDKKLEIQITSQVDAEIVQVFRIEQGDKIIVDEFPLKTDGNRIFKDTVAQAFYVVKFNRVERKIYGKAGELVKLIVTDSTIDYVKPNKENKILDKWYNLSKEARRYSVKYHGLDSNELFKRTPFYDRQRALESASEDFHKQISKYRGDDYFKNAMHLLVDTEMTYFKVFFMQIPLLGYYDKNELPEDLYGSIKNEKRFSDPGLLEVFEYLLPYGKLYSGWCQYKDYTKMKPTIEYFASPEIKVAYLLGWAEMDKSGVELEKLEKKYLHLFKSGYSLQRLKKLQEQFAYLKDSSKTPNFEFQKLDDEIVPLSNYYGKLIVIDVWATWCGPCMKARPDFEALAEEMKDEDVTFIGVSVDDSDLKWKKTASNSHCVELRDKEKAFSKAYGLTTIPRYMIFSKEGGLLVKSAPSPKTSDLKKEILKHLGK
ncbi:TlpA family protein disulfide reductase [Aestuariibaculum suncheonense]|uniref:TlpA family protein disulfide reductase n=1 Tax=Aestuariibaculum suncheonense TaxID=1028745 RepID=A0A8J6Q5S7_9FLAO|nr:TlpA disulfide reductase family protein [Aestuariibaculum suncheonense]MBD0835433.1 TlpA family protein disulfide reductase [Aestuariibaculum suncheonense]